MLDGVPLGQLGVEGINNNDALSLTVLAAVTFTSELPNTDTNPAGHRPCAYSLDSASMLPSCSHRMRGGGGGGSIRALDDIFEFTSVTDHDWRTLECTRANDMAINALFERTCPEDPEYGSWVKSLKPDHWEYIQEGKRARGRTTRHSRSSYHHCPHLHLLPSPPLDAGKHTIPPQVGNLDRRLYTTPVNHRLLLESGRDVSPTGRGLLNQEENIRRLCPKPSKRGGTPH